MRFRWRTTDLLPIDTNVRPVTDARFGQILQISLARFRLKQSNREIEKGGFLITLLEVNPSRFVVRT